MLSERTKENIGVLLIFTMIGMGILLVLCFNKGFYPGQKVHIMGESGFGEIVKKASEETYYLVRVTRGKETIDLVFPASQLSLKP